MDLDRDRFEEPDVGSGGGAGAAGWVEGSVSGKLPSAGVLKASSYIAGTESAIGSASPGSAGNPCGPAEPQWSRQANDRRCCMGEGSRMGWKSREEERACRGM